MTFYLSFSDHEGATYFGELEEALMQGVSGISTGSNKKRMSLSLSGLHISDNPFLGFYNILVKFVKSNITEDKWCDRPPTLSLLEFLSSYSTSLLPLLGAGAERDRERGREGGRGEDQKQNKSFFTNTDMHL